MPEATTIPTLTSDNPENLTAAAHRAEAWVGEPFLQPDEDALAALAPGTARRAALDDASAEMDAGLERPSSRWKVRYGLMLGLERVLTENPARTAAGTELRRHQVDALAGMLAELIAATQRSAEENGNGNGSGNGVVAEAEIDEEADDDFDAGFIEEKDLEPSFSGADPGAVRRYRFRHPTASLVLGDEAHPALGEKTSAAIRAFHEPLYIGMTATEQLIAKQVSDVFPASVDDLPLGDAARRGPVAPLRCLRVPPAAAINSVPIVGGDFEERALAAALDHEALNQAAASLYRDRFGSTPGIVYAAGVAHAYNLAQEFRAAGLMAEAVSGRTPLVKLAETLAAYERGEINLLINAQLLAEGWNSPRATVCMHLAPTASRRVYQQRIGRIM